MRIHHHVFHLPLTATFAALVLAGTVSAATINGSATLDAASPSFKRPSTDCQAGGSDFKFVAVDFVVDTTGTYTIDAPVNAQVTDPWLQLYSSPFTASLPLANCIQGDDDSGAGLGAQLANVPLVAGQVYTAVITTYNPSQVGTVNWSITGAGNLLRRNGFIKAAGTEDFANGQVSVALRLSSNGGATSDELRWVAVPPGSPTPSFAEVIAGQQSGGSAAPVFGTLPGQPIEVDTTVTLTGLAVNTPYDLYITLNNTAQLATVRKLGFTPTPPVFATKTGVATNTPTSSDAATLTGFTETVAISVSAGEYSINGGAFTSAPGTAQPGDSLQLRQSSASSAGASRIATVTLGTVTSTFTVVTAAPVGPVPIPTVSQWGMLLMSTLLAAGAFLTLRRRRS